MTLDDYIDTIRFELGQLDLPPEYLRRQINYARREVARRTRALECTSQCDSVADQADYRIPHSSNDSTFVDCVTVLDIKYDGNLITWTNPRDMNYRATLEQSGEPIYWCYYGGESQPTGYIKLEPTPDTAGKIIEIHSIQFPLPLINNADICELNDIIQQVVIHYVEGLILSKRGFKEGATLLQLAERGIRDNTKLRSL